MRFWELAVRFLRYDSRLYLGAFVGLMLVLLPTSLADVVHFQDGKTLRGKLHSVTGDLIDFKPRFFRIQSFQRLHLMNRRDVVEMRNMEKIFGEIMYADGFHVEIITASGRTKLNRFLIKNIVLGTPEQPPVDIPSKPSLGTSSTPKQGDNWNTGATPARIAPQPEKPTFMFPPPNTRPEDLDAINTDDRLP